MSPRANGTPTDHTGGVDETDDAIPAILLEFTDPTALGMTLDQPTATDLMVACAALLTRVAVEPGRCRLIITGDFVESARRRMEPGRHRDNYDLRRSTGTVGGKTMPMPDGTVDVLLPASLFAFGMTPEQDAAATQDALYTVLHEGQHVAMTQAGETDPDLGHLPHGRLNLENAADEVIQEYRAERAIDRSVVPGLPPWDLVAVLQHWHETLVRIAFVEYQEHRDVERLWYGVVQETFTTWKLLAYIAAWAPEDTPPKAAVSKDLRRSPVWRLMVKPHWRRFVEILRQAPPGDVRTAPAALESVRCELADEFAAWLLTLGFEGIDTADGFAFYIRGATLIDDFSG